MGFYIETDGPVNKADYLVKNHGGVKIREPKEWEEGLVCVVENGMFDAAGYCFSEKEFETFTTPDRRFKIWVKMDDKLAQKLSGYSKSDTP
jgi:hypothetical protein